MLENEITKIKDVTILKLHITNNDKNKKEKDLHYLTVNFSNMASKTHLRKKSLGADKVQGPMIAEKS